MSGRVVNVRTTEAYDVYVGRGRDPRTGIISPWGNPYSHLDGTMARYRVKTRDDAIRSFEEMLDRSPQLLERLHELKGKTLGCWCAPLPCHADVLVRRANALP